MAIALMLVAVFVFSVINVLVKSLTARYSIVEISFFRSLFALGPTLIMVWAGGGLSSVRTDRFGSHLRRALIGVSSIFLIFWSFQLLPLADAIAISFSAPLFLTALSVPLLGERVGAWRWGAVAVGFSGVLIMVHPDRGLFQLGALVSLAGAVAYALAMITIRDLSRTERPTTIVFWFTLMATLITGALLPLAWQTPDGEDLLMLAAVGLLAGVAQQVVTNAFSLGPPAVLGAFNYAAILWATLFGWLFFGDIPSLTVLAGAAVGIASGLFIVFRETRRRTAD
ncbi:S-adenosylmethionine uptake transporter [Azospirillaceae bacterium]